MWVILVIDWSNAGFLELSFSEASGLEFCLSSRGSNTWWFACWFERLSLFEVDCHPLFIQSLASLLEPL